MPGNNIYRFSLSLDRDTLLEIYHGTIKRIRVRTFEGLVVDIDANHLKRFTTQDGIFGKFELVTTSENKFLEIVKID
jgi:hypothetical protein